MAFGFNKGLQTLTVQEAQNASLGQLGSVYLDTASTTFTPSKPRVIMAIMMLTDCKFDTLTPENNDYAGIASGEMLGTGYEAGGNAITSSDIFPRGLILYGRWSSISLQSNTMKCICYMG
tara:strand:+ start:2328 stop:2687 length:360 start_codon:yes stop_codon:yes gene_type:complete